MGDYYSENFLQSAQRGNLEECRKCLAQNIDINYTDKEGNTAMMLAVQNNQLDIVRFLINNEANIQAQNEVQSTCLHMACDKNNKELILLLLTSGADPTAKNLNSQKPGDGNMEMKGFINNVMSENRAFNVLKPQQKMKLQAIFEDIDTDNQKFIDMIKAIKFNKYIEEVNDNVAERDAKDFLKAVAICNGQRVNIDEWLHSFSKLLVVEQATFDKFIDDYDKTVEKKQKLRLQNLD